MNILDDPVLSLHVFSQSFSRIKRNAPENVHWGWRAGTFFISFALATHLGFHQISCQRALVPLFSVHSKIAGMLVNAHPPILSESHRGEDGSKAEKRKNIGNKFGTKIGKKTVRNLGEKLGRTYKEKGVGENKGEHKGKPAAKKKVGKTWGEQREEHRGANQRGQNR